MGSPDRRCRRGCCRGGRQRSDLANRKRSHEDSLNSPSADPTWPKVMMNFPFLSNFMMSELPKSAHGLRRRRHRRWMRSPPMSGVEQLQALPPWPALPSQRHQHLGVGESSPPNTFAGRGSASDHPDIAVSTGYDPMGENPRMRALPETIMPAPKFFIA
jgi:hypothetical protein